MCITYFIYVINFCHVNCIVFRLVGFCGLYFVIHFYEYAVWFFINLHTIVTHLNYWPFCWFDYNIVCAVNTFLLYFRSLYAPSNGFMSNALRCHMIYGRIIGVLYCEKFNGLSNKRLIISSNRKILRLRDFPYIYIRKYTITQ